jgi:hypothetical protein
MARSEFKRLYITSQEFTLGPLRWRSTSVHAAEELESDNENTLQTFVERLQALIQQALREGCTSQELDTILGQHTLGDHHVDA